MISRGGIGTQCAALVALGGLLFGARSIDVIFLDLSAQRGMDPAQYQMAFGMTAGAAAADYDKDGDIDVFVPTACGHGDMLFRNMGDGVFEEIGATVGLNATNASRVALWFDYDGDHDLDLLVGHDDWDEQNPCPTRPFTMYKQVTPLVFVDVTIEAGLLFPEVANENEMEHAAGMCAGDIDNDGWLDLCATIWLGETRLFRNNGKGGFENISQSSGLADQAPLPWQPVMVDFNGDGWLDIFIAIDVHANQLWINQGDLTFIDIAAQAGVDNAWNEMCVAVGDYDNDGRFDMYLTNIEGDVGGDWRHNLLYHNTSAGGVVSFENVAEHVGVGPGGWGWGATFFDADNDSLLDIVATNGFWSPWEVDQSLFFHNTGDGFEDMSNRAGFNDDRWGGGLLAFDSERDGDLDILQLCNLDGGLHLMCTHPVAARGTRGGEARNWLVIKPRMSGTNHFAIGTVVKARVGDIRMMRLITAGIGSLTQEPAEAFFGFRDAQVVDEVEIRWPHGVRTLLRDVPANQMHTVTPEQGIVLCDGDADRDGLVNVADLLAVITGWGQTGGHLEGDVNDDHLVNVADLLAVINNWGGGCG